MKRLADLYFNYDIKSGEYLVSSFANMQEKDEQLVEDLMRDSRLRVQLNNACKNINNMSRTDKDVEVTKFDVNLNSSISSASNVRVVVTLLKDGDESDLMISLFSMVAGPTI